MLISLLLFRQPAGRREEWMGCVTEREGGFIAMFNNRTRTLAELLHHLGCLVPLASETPEQHFREDSEGATGGYAL